MVSKILFSKPEDVALLCRQHGIAAPGGMAALSMLLTRLTGKPVSADYMHLRVGDERYGMTATLREFVRKFNFGEYPEIDLPEHRSAFQEVDDDGERTVVLGYYTALLGTTAEAVAERLRRAGCFGETAEEALETWFGMCVCDEVQVGERNVCWRASKALLSHAVRDFMRRWDEFPLVHFAIKRQLEEGSADAEAS